MAKPNCTETINLFECNEKNEISNYVSDWKRPEGSRIFGVDYGGSGHSFAVVRDDDPSQCRFIQPEKFIELNFTKEGDFIVIEYPHVQPRNKRISLAQPLTYEQLQTLEINAQIKKVEIKVVSQNMTYKFRNSIYGEDSKTDHHDAHALIVAASIYGINKLHKFKPHPPKTFSEFQEFAHEQVKEMNDLLNLWRMQYETSQSPCLILFEKYLIHVERLLMQTPDEGSRLACRWFFGKNASMDGKTSAVLSLWVSLFAWDGTPRRFQGEIVSIANTMGYLLGNKPFHHKGGVARSNLWKFGFKRVCTDLKVPEKIDRSCNSESYQKLQSAKSKYRKAMKATLKAMRKIYQDRM